MRADVRAARDAGYVATGQLGPGPASCWLTRAGLALGRAYACGEAIQAAIWARELKPSLLRMLRTWLSTVRSEMNRRAPICLLVRPSATSRATSASRFASTPAAAPRAAAA